MHTCKDECNPSIREVFKFGHTVEEVNRHVRYTVSVIAGEKIVGHLQQEISKD